MKDEKNTQSCEAQLQNRDYEDIKEGTENEKSPNEPLCEEFHDENGSEENYFDNEPVEILLNDEDFKRVEADNGEIDAEKGRTDNRRKDKRVNKKYDESILQEYAVISFIVGLLSCSVFIGNMAFALIGLWLGFSSKRYGHKSIYSTIGILCSIIGLIIPVFVVMVVIALLSTVLLFSALLYGFLLASVLIMLIMEFFGGTIISFLSSLAVL